MKEWERVECLYRWLDFKHRGYIDVKDATQWLLKLKEKPEIYEAQGSISTTMKLPDLLLAVLDALSAYFSSRGVIEKSIFYFVVKDWVSKQSEWQQPHS